MSVSIQEIGLVLIACVLVAAFAGKRTWLWGIPAQLTIIAICTPADPVSTLMIGLPCSLIYVFALLRTEKQARPEPVSIEK